MDCMCRQSLATCEFQHRKISPALNAQRLQLQKKPWAVFVRQ